MLSIIDSYLNRITMYKLVLWGLRIMAAFAIVFSLTGTLGLPLKGLVISLVILIVVCNIANRLLSRFLKIPANTESYAITLLILFLILPPATSVSRALIIALAGVLAIASKFLITWHGKHIFNPAAFGAAAVSLLGLMGTTWWVGNAVMWPIVLIIGLLVVRKIRRFSMMWSFAVVVGLITAITAVTQHQEIGDSIRVAISSSPAIFLGTIMLTEPATMPAHRRQQVIFGVLVGLLYALYIKLGPLQIYPEVALLIGNIYAFAVTPKYRLHLKLKEVQKISDRVHNYVFTPNRPVAFEAGQYLEWTLPHEQVDGRGNRRTFSFASSPTEQDVMLGVKFYNPSSSFKTALQAMQPGDEVMAGQIAGDFTLPADTNEKLAFIAGGIGITPFRSMLKYLIDEDQHRDIVMIYTVSDPAELAYADVLETAKAHGVRFIPLLTADKAPLGWNVPTGKLDEECIISRIPDFKDRTFYLSGPQGMVQSGARMLHGMGAPKVKTDYFSGY